MTYLKTDNSRKTNKPIVTPISIVIISLNEASIIEKCLKAAIQISDDIIVMDSGSTDGTIEIAKKYTDKVYIVNWIGYGPTRNLGADKAKYEWIFSLDCDEVPDNKMIAHLKGIKLKNKHLYKLSFKSNFWGKWMRFSGLRPDRRRKIYQKSRHSWNDNKVHERLTNQNITPNLNIKGNILHYSYQNIQDMIDKYDTYAKLSAQNLIAKNKKPGLLKKWFAPSFRFIKTYFLQLGFLDGTAGWIYAYQSARMVKKRYIYYKQLTSQRSPYL